MSFCAHNTWQQYNLFASFTLLLLIIIIIINCSQYFTSYCDCVLTLAHSYSNQQNNNCPGWLSGPRLVFKGWIKLSPYSVGENFLRVSWQSLKWTIVCEIMYEANMSPVSSRHNSSPAETRGPLFVENKAPYDVGALVICSLHFSHPVGFSLQL